MTPDLVSTVRAALAAAQAAQAVPNSRSRNFLLANAPVWLAQCLTEIEGLRADLLAFHADREGLWSNARADKEAKTRLIAERDAAVAECARLRNSIEEIHVAWANVMEENERLRGLHADSINPSLGPNPRA